MQARRHNRSMMRYLHVALLATALSILCAGLTMASPPAEAPKTVHLPPSALQAPPRGFASPPQQDQVAAHRLKIDIDLMASSLVFDQHGRLLAHIVADPADIAQARRAVIAAGGEVAKVSWAGDVLQCWLPAEQIEGLAQAAVIEAIREPSVIVPIEDPAAYLAAAELAAGSWETEAMAAINAPAWHAAGHRGAGVRVGIIDVAFRGVRALRGSELPEQLSMLNFVDGEPADDIDTTSQDSHGTACAEIVYDVAPDAQLYLAKIRTYVDIEQAVRWMIEQQVDIISTSFGDYNVTPGDGTGLFANMVQRARRAGIVWVTAAGNERQAHWGGSWHDTDADGWHEFAPGQWVNWYGPADGSGDAYLVPAGKWIQVYLRWDDWQQVDQNYDLYVLRWDAATNAWIEVASSTRWQTGQSAQRPAEWCILQAPEPGVYGYAIKRQAADRPVHFESFAIRVYGLSQRESARSVVNLADVAEAITVAALEVEMPWPQADYSSQGPTNGPGGARDGGALKPDLSAYARVSTSSYGAGGFEGTSAATPHLAGAAALVLGAWPEDGPDQVRQRLIQRAVDMGAPGPDSVFGWGRLTLGQPPPAPSPTVTPVTTLPASGGHTLRLPLVLRGSLGR